MYPLLSMAWLPDASWVIPLTGGTVTCAALVFGWRLLVAKPASRDMESDGLADARFLQGVTQERRATPRRKGNTVEVELVDDANETPLIAWVLDRSYGGLLILADQSIPKGTVLRVRPRKAASSSLWTCVTVRSCKRIAGQYELGCQFHQTPNWNLLIMFG